MAKAETKVLTVGMLLERLAKIDPAATVAVQSSTPGAENREIDGVFTDLFAENPEVLFSLKARVRAPREQKPETQAKSA